MNKFYISALLLPVICISAAYAEGSLDTTCVNSISAAQYCLKECVDEGPFVDVYGNIYFNRLLKCIETNSIFSPELLDCCDVSETIDCNAEMNTTNACLNFTLSPVKQALTTYFTCVVESSSSYSYCHPGFCVGVITGGYGMNLDNDFDLGDQGGVGALMRVAQNCSDLDSFTTNVCKTIGSCCQPCASHLATVTEAVTNFLLLPSYNQDLLESSGGGCTDMACNLPPPTQPPTQPAPPASNRQLEGEESAAASGGDGDNAVSEDAVLLATECNDKLVTNVVVYNESYAVGVFFECIMKRAAKLMTNPKPVSSSGSSSFLFGSKSSLAVSALALVILAIAVIH